MKRVVVSLMVVVGALLSACTEEEETLQTAGLAGTYDLVQVGDLLFVTSTGRDELRVLELTPEGRDRGYLPAPNPLEPLSIPVLRRPQALTRDLRYVEGSEVAGPYVYVRSNGSTEISVVATDRGLLREVRRLSTTRLTASLPTPSTGPVTAFAARGPEQAGEPSTLYYATQEPMGARLWVLRLPGPQALLDGAALAAEPLGVELPPNVAVSSLIVLPQSGQLALATRGAAGTLGRSYTLDVAARTLRELDFGGAQVAQLATHGRVEYVTRGENDTEVRHTLEEGARIFGILDASSCGGQRRCLGVLAVERGTGRVAKDATGFDMLPISAGFGLPMGLSLSTNARLLFPSGVATIPLLGIVPLSNGDILFFDALGLRPFDVDPEAAGSTAAFVTAAGTSRPDTGDISIEVTNGVTPDETYRLTYQGVLPGMASLGRDPETSLFKVPFQPRGAAKGQVAQPGDLIVLFPEGAGAQPCGTDLVVDSVQPPTATEPLAVLTTRPPIPAACAGFTRFQVRAAGNQPLVLSSTAEDYIQRLGVNDTYSRTGPYFFHPDNYSGATEGVAVRLTVAIRRVDELRRGDSYVVGLQSHFFPYLITVDISIPELSPFRLPGPVVQTDVGDTDYAYIVYPSADGVLQVDLQSIAAGLANSRGVFPYR